MTTSKTRPRDLMLGLLFFAGLITLVVITTQLRNWPGVGSRNYLPVLFEDIYGVKKEDRVLVYGTTWGRVASVQPISPDKWREAAIDVQAQLGIRLKPGQVFEPHVLAILELDYDLDLREGYTVLAEDANLLGGKVVTISPGEPGSVGLAHEGFSLSLDAANPDDLRQVKFYGKRHPHPITAIGEFVDGNQEDFREIVKKVKAAVDSAVDPNQSTLGYLLADKGGRDKVDSILTEFQKFGRTVNNEGSLVYDVTHADTQLRKDLNKVVADVREATGRIDDPETMLGSLLAKNSPTKQRVDTILGDIQSASSKLNRNDSLIGRIFAEGDQALGARAQSLVDNVAQMVDDAKKNQDSLLYNVFYGDMGKSLRTGVDSFKSIATKIETAVVDPIEKREGILGLLVSDPEAKKKFERMINATLGIIEDAREAAPVTSLGSFLFGGF